MTETGLVYDPEQNLSEILLDLVKITLISRKDKLTLLEKTTLRELYDKYVYKSSA